jgi:hypothetical protein
MHDTILLLSFLIIVPSAVAVMGLYAAWRERHWK